MLIDVTAMSMPASSMNEGALSLDHGGGAMPPTGPLVVRLPKEEVGQDVMVHVDGSHRHAQKRRLSILKARILDSNVDRGTPRRSAAPEGP